MVTRRATALLGIGLALLGCAGKAGGEGAAPTAGGEVAAEAGFPGEVVPTNATDVFPPLVLISRSSWSGFVWSPNNLKLVELAEDGKAVKQGDVIARFDPMWLADEIKESDDGLQKARAAAESSEASIASERTRLEAEGEQKRIVASRAALDLGKQSAISAQAFALYQIDAEIAAFDADAAAKRLAAHLAYARGEREYYRMSITSSEDEVKYLKAVVDRFTVRAPHDGVVRHLLHQGLRRKVQNGDEIPLTKPFIALARDEKLSVRFYVPEAAVAGLAVGAVVEAIDPVSSRPFAGAVRRIQPFPQEIGVVKGDPELPNARDTVHVATADLAPAEEGLSSGSEVQVRRR